jgi:quinol-cytochrome oxidoreductase complex cytochrome b subunit
MYTEFLQKRLVLPIENIANQFFSQKYNPFYYHGAMPNFFLWMLFISGLLLFAYYTPTLERAYASMSYISHELPFGNVFRSTHRYAADGMMLFVMIHLARVWFTDRYREYRIVPWISGVILLTIMFLVGMTGYLMIWDQDAVTLTYATINLLRQVPLFGAALAQGLLAGTVVTDYTLTRFLFLHLAIPAAMMFFLWLHYLRITRPVTNTPFAINLVLFGGLLFVAGLIPVGLGVAPLLNRISPQIDMDLLYVWPQWLLTHGWSTALVLLAVIAVPVGLLVLPYLQKKALRGQYAKVLNANCTGCSLCYNDCPYEAITMVDRNNDGTRFKRLAVVDAGRCSNCGLCVGACAFKAIEIPRRETASVLDEIQLALANPA